MFRTYPYTFTTDEAAKVMASLVFTHVHRNPDPANPARQIATRTTTTFSMDYGTAKNLIQHFLSARLIVSATDPTNWNVRDKGLWCPTLKGKYVMEEFTDSTQVEMTDTLIAALNAPYMSPGTSGSTGSRIITLDRLLDNDDQITFSRPNMTAAFKAMMASLPRDALLIDDISGIEKSSLPIFQYTFVGLHCVEWLTERLTVTSIEEAESVASEFVLFGWIAQVLDKSDKAHSTKDDTMTFRTARNAIYYVTERGCVVTGWKSPVASEETAVTQASNQSSSSGLSLDSDVSSIKPPIPRGLPKQISAPPAMSKYSYYDPLENDHAIVAAAPASTEMVRHDSATGLIEPKASSAVDSNSIESVAGPEQQQQNRHSFHRPPSMSITDSSLSHNSNASSTTTATPYMSKDNSQWTRLAQILETPLIRMYFRDFLRSNYSEENINFWVDHNKLLRNLKQSKKSVLEQLSECYAIYETYLGHNATADVNIDHTLHQEIIKYVTAVFSVTTSSVALPAPAPVAGATTATAAQSAPKYPYFIVMPTNQQTLTTNQPIKASKASSRLLLMPPEAVSSSKQRIVIIRGISPERCLIKLLKMFGRVNDHVCAMMAEDSVPKFIKTEKYKKLIAKQQRDALALETDADNDGESGDESDDDISFEDSSDEDNNNNKQQDRKRYVHLATALAAQRSSMDHQRHEANANNPLNAAAGITSTI
ncbi:hypothetical protein [Parasitella parasitica]|uniref:RGS domain-containing protein n=1 Tax=Parasitella parasitica TaxID=35722 RepID=A0A0B7NGW9_9FUNG|nr:hypothetical protein [Parasitella parasitica]